jgi:type IX secretion system PorP/SprF family membrane protein
LLHTFFKILSLFFFILPVQLTAQDPAFSQFYAAPVYLNPAYAGTTLKPKIHLNFRDQWPAFEHAYVSYAASYDQFFDKMNSGISVGFLGDRAGGGIYNTNQVMLGYTYQINLSENLALRAGVQGGFIQRRLDFSKITFLDQIHPVNGPSIPTSELLKAEPVRSVGDFSAGGIIFSTKLFAGFAAHHIIKGSDAFVNNENFLPVKYTIHGGGVFIRENNNGDVTFSPNFLYTRQLEFQQLNVGSYLKKGFIFGGLWLRHNIVNADAVIVLAGVQYNILKIGYSYDISIGKMAGKTGGSHEVAIILNFDESDRDSFKEKSIRSLQCPPLF